ncbi:MAG TPA: enoyl-ACP reductase [Vicinamibacterales bacterium]|nr:enoyl-ACP reductase [Vicinamibacterales bacterium]
MALTGPTLPARVGLVIGVANKRSIAWAIARAASLEGAQLAITYQNERLEENVRELAASIAEPLVMPCDVTDDGQMDALFGAIEKRFGGLDFLVHSAAFAERADLDGQFRDTSRSGFLKAMEISAYSLIALSKRAAPLMANSSSARILTLSYLGSERVFPNYNVMGVAKAALECTVRYLASDLGPMGIRVNAISAGPIKTLAASGIPGFSKILDVYRERAPIRRTVETSEVAEVALMLLGPAGRGITGEVILVDGGFHAMGI